MVSFKPKSFRTFAPGQEEEIEKSNLNTKVSDKLRCAECEGQCYKEFNTCSWRVKIEIF